jgi:thiol-disulfide isomerase/thioredoxin
VLVVSTVLALLAAAGTVVLLSDGGDEADDDALTAVTLVPSDEVPTFDEAVYTTFDGEEVPFASVRGTPTVVNFFSSTCTPCITEMPDFEAVYQEVKDHGVTFLGLAVADRTDAARDLVEDTGVTYPTAQDRDASVITMLEGVGLPTTVLLDADGRVVKTFPARAITADELRSALAQSFGIET